MFRTIAPSFFAVMGGWWSCVDARRDSPMLPNRAKGFGDDSALALSIGSPPLPKRQSTGALQNLAGPPTVHGKETPPKIGRESGP